MRRCFRISLQECQNVSVETWIRASKFSLKIQSRSEDINKIKTESHVVEYSISTKWNVQWVNKIVAWL